MCLILWLRWTFLLKHEPGFREPLADPGMGEPRENRAAADTGKKRIGESVDFRSGLG